MRTNIDLSSRTLTCSLIFFTVLFAGRSAHSVRFDHEDVMEEEGVVEFDLIGMEETEAVPPSEQIESQFTVPSPHFSKDWGIVLNADFLYWKAKEEGLSYALASPNYTTVGIFAQSNITKGVKGKISRLNTDYEPGVRLYANCLLPRDHWDIEMSWTYYRNTQTSSQKAHSNRVIFPYWLNPNFDPLAIKAFAHWKLAFNNLNITLGRVFSAGKFFSLHPFAGFQAAWIEQHFNINYKTISFDNGQTTPHIKSKNKNSTQGYGILAGLEAKWELWCGFAFQGDFSGALLWTDFDLYQQEKNGNHSVRSRLKDSFHQVTAVLNLFAGLSWETQFHKERFYLQFHTGWEEQVWFDQNQLNRFLSNHTIGSTTNLQGDLSFSGWTIGAKFGF